ncbi:MAG TPA: hypothetical protein VG964_01460 [Candidatus Saccharimonadales bacterium]|nr:hypothetical protein [Candidatus Saccharimonadales bacterium]
MAEADIIQFPTPGPEDSRSDYKVGSISAHQWGSQEVIPYTHEDTRRAIEWAGLEPMLENETIVDWHRRTNGGKGTARLALTQTIETETLEGDK